MSEKRLIVAIACGGAVGSMARYGLSLLSLSAVPGWFFAGTLAANIAGSALIGLIAAWSVRRMPSPILNGFLVTGFCGGFTTFSAFSLEALLLVMSGAWAVALGYVVASILSWMAAVWLGWSAGMALFGAKGSVAHTKS
ncbi:CrcB family protein [Pelagibacterium flavum]|uniref:Fluoride-specific ion channel FluC n=1 Tax=Pelagibacterium flavum TaxID=2984530 RepID=A0ABY6IM45_9HYPH|nr:CrcB family protein [Pelagibacterium sp. YIM 151497]MAN78144.1 chromosome condensation protein CrcB [Hyphomicrobiales bacterium]UYQ71672.1 CrcB family protein [Pelagibacterium sp. YIM 151497]|tara:strand:- start:9 stop:425 length:417 start_codon:yes stop_codon:yes gene_type:complete